MKVSVILTVLNEAQSLPRLLDSLAAQTLRPDQVIVADGGSTDGTLALLQAEQARARLPLFILEQPGSNIAQGRNSAIAAARGEIIAVTDAGVRLAPEWLENLLAPFQEGSAKPVGVAGFFRPDPCTLFEVAMAATVLPELRDIKPDRFLPSSRSLAVRKEAAQMVGGYPEWLDYCEDLVFDLRLKNLFRGFAFAPDALVFFRPRRTLGAFFKQYFRYARGDGKADLWRTRHLIRYAAYLLAVPFIGLLGWRRNPRWWALSLISLPAMFATPWRRLRPLWRDYGLRDRVEAIAWVPVIRLTGDVAKMLGYPVGLWWRWRHKPPDWRDWNSGKNNVGHATRNDR
jgi:glycosyltransferase involved in cell wall biosynthesis